MRPSSQREEEAGATAAYSASEPASRCHLTKEVSASLNGVTAYSLQRRSIYASRTAAVSSPVEPTRRKRALKTRRSSRTKVAARGKCQSARAARRLSCRAGRPAARPDGSSAGTQRSRRVADQTAREPCLPSSTAPNTTITPRCRRNWRSWSSWELFQLYNRLIHAPACSTCWPLALRPGERLLLDELPRRAESQVAREIWEPVDESGDGPRASRSR